MILYALIGLSCAVNIFLGWYLIKILKKFIFISETIGDLYLTAKAFQVFVTSMYGMDSYHGEPLIEELIGRLKELGDEIENFREVFEHTLDEELERELEEELNAPEKEALHPIETRN
tara:strand:- start:246 stop:596 length:351 start_codon:yes stop_codon:yes gene_type:complete